MALDTALRLGPVQAGGAASLAVTTSHIVAVSGEFTPEVDPPATSGSWLIGLVHLPGEPAAVLTLEVDPSAIQAGWQRPLSTFALEADRPVY